MSVVISGQHSRGISPVLAAVACCSRVSNLVTKGYGNFDKTHTLAATLDTPPDTCPKPLTKSGKEITTQRHSNIGKPQQPHINI
jgi:hypothetical protein